ncbi:hypothetical protein K7432_014290 [Basidiobolus ranarum]|uniref:Reverse transcriptase domain-containing protein n=1 Tax=Basidiobolus ranarum TaxID=34480 RepID=A0ABR2WHU6_9FUNG
MNTNSKMTGSSYKDTLSAITSIKLNELKSQKTRLDAHHKKTLHNTENSTDLLEKLKILCQGVKDTPIPQTDSVLQLENIETLILQASSDPSTSSYLLQYWIDRLKKDVNRELQRSEYAYHFGLIMSEWLGSENTSTDTDSWIEVDQTASSAEVKSAKLETEQQLRDMIFDKADVDPATVKDFLNNEIFNLDSKEDKEFLDTVIKEVGEFGSDLCERIVTEENMKHTVDGLLNSDLLPADKQTVLQEVRENETILKEFASVLNVMLRNVANWCWPEEGVPVDLRRGLNGKYRAFMEEDIITALFLQYVGAEWCAFLKKKFISIYDSNIWVKPDVLHKRTIVGHRQKLQRSTFLLSSLPDSVEFQSKNAYAEDNGNENNSDDDSEKKSAMDIKHGLLHLMNVEARLHQTLKPDQGFTIVRSDFEWFGPSIPHQVIQVFLEFFGVPKIWMNFFEQYLKTPIVLPSDKSLQTRQRGVPISHLLSTIFAETILFGLDLYIVRSTGIFLYRIHDDLWFWDSDSSKVELAWNNMKKFSDIMGLKLNQEKSGSVTIFSADKLQDIAASSNLNQFPLSKEHLEKDVPPIYYGQGSLPQDTVKWGFIVLHSDGAFHIDESSMTTFISEMENRLSAANSIIEWVNVFNKYMAFFLRNFGKFANVFGVQHANQVIEALKMIENKIFRQHNGNVLTCLSTIIKARIPSFQDATIPDAWIYWPINAGGLGLKNPFIEILALRKAMESDESGDGFSQLPEKDEKLYNEKKAAYDKAREPVYRYNDGASDDLDDSGDELTSKEKRKFASILVEEQNEYGDKVKRLLSFDEYCEGRETRLVQWFETYEELLSLTSPESPSYSAEVFDNAFQLRSGAQDGEFSDVYWEWIVCHYVHQFRDTFGCLHLMDSELVPMGMISILKSSKVKFDE